MTKAHVKFQKSRHKMGLDARKPVFFLWGGGGVANNKGADQPAHPRRLISAFVFAFCKVSYVNLLHVTFQFYS